MDYPETEPQPSGLTDKGAEKFSTAFSSAASKDDDWWIRAEDLAAELIGSIQPIPSSERRRHDIVGFVQDLIGNCIDGAQVETFGSVPLKTYLPDGDIDLTALSCHTHFKETWAQDVVKALNVQSAVENDNAQFRVKDVQYIQADVKIIKCLVERTVVDISFNQTGGLDTFIFLEKVDRYIGQDHLFKKSIILVKAWCYYESRVLGADHGLISTYALETLVLYIFHVFHSSLRGPLKVLYIFLVYFSNFDWEKYCVSLWGPVPLSPDPPTKSISVDSAESPWKGGGSLLLTKEFLDKCIEECSGASAVLESNQRRDFNKKFLNVFDPIRDTNNLGRSVHLGNFKRIRSAFGLGARTLAEFLQCSQDQINEKFKSFFSCTFENLERYRSGGRPDTGNPVARGVKHPSSGAGKERLSSGCKQENGSDTRHSPRTTSVEENVGPPFQHNYSCPGHFYNHWPINGRPMVSEYQGRAPSQDSPQWVSSRVDSVEQGSFYQSRDGSDPSLSLSNHDVGRQPGPLGDSKTSSSHRNPNRKLYPGDENDTFTSGRKSTSSEESKATYSMCVPHQYPSPGDISYQGHCQNSGNQNMLQPLSYRKPPPLQLPEHIYRAQMHLPASSAIPVPAPSSSGPPSASSSHSTHYSPSSGEPFTNRSNLYVPMHTPPIYPPGVPATSSCMASIAPLGDVPCLSPHAEENWRSPIEGQMQPLHRASGASSASPGRSFPMENTYLSESYWMPFSVPPPMQPQFVFRKSKPGQGGSVRPVEIAEFSKAYAPIGENLSRLLISDKRLGESSCQLEEETDHLALRTRKRANRSKSLEMKVSDGRHANSIKGAGQLFRSQSLSDKPGRCISRSVDGHGPEISLHRISHPCFEETSVGDMQGALLPPFPSPPHIHQEILSTIPRIFKGSPIQSGPDGVFRGDAVGGLYSNGSMGFGTDIRVSQSHMDARLRMMPQVGMGFAERPQEAVAVISPRNRVEMSNVERMSDEAGPGELQDILCGSSKEDKEKLLLSFRNALELLEGSDRQKGDLNLSQQLGGAGPSYPSRGRVAQGTQQSRGSAFHGSEDTLPKSGAGTGTLPSPKRHAHSNRERPGPGGGGGGWGGSQRGAYGQQDRNNHDRSNQPHAPRHRSVGQAGQGQHGMHEPRAQMMKSAQKNPAPDLGNSNAPHPHQQSMEKRGLPPVSSPPVHSTQPSFTGHYFARSNGHSGTGTNAPVVMQHSGNDARTGFSPELEFGSLGSMRSG